MGESRFIHFVLKKELLIRTLPLFYKHERLKHSMIQSLQFLSLPSGVKRFLATESLYGLSIGMFTLILNLHFIEMGISEKQIGFITSMGILVMGIFAIPVSILAKNRPKKAAGFRIMSIAIGCSIFAFAESFAFFFWLNLSYRLV